MTQANQLLTLLLPLKGREAFTLRLVRYLDDIGFPFSLYLADGSEETSDAIAGIVDAYPNLDIVYRRFPPDATYTDFYGKMFAALSEIRTPYVSLIDNDCFPVVEGLSESLRFLQEHDDYSTCRGQHIDYVLSPYADNEEDLLHGAEMTSHPAYFDRGHSIWRSFEKDDPLARMIDWSHCTNITYYNVFPTDILAQAWEFIWKNECCDLFFCEIALALNALAYGKSKVLDIPFTVRQQNATDSVSKQAIGRMDILDRMLVEKWTRDINQLIDTTAATASRTSGCPREDAAEQVRLAIKNHYADRLYTYLHKRETAKGEQQADPYQSQPRIRYTAEHQPEGTHPGVSAIVHYIAESPSA